MHLKLQLHQNDSNQELNKNTTVLTAMSPTVWTNSLWILSQWYLFETALTAFGDSLLAKDPLTTSPGICDVSLMTVVGEKVKLWPEVDLEGGILRPLQRCFRDIWPFGELLQRVVCFLKAADYLRSRLRNREREIHIF